MRSMRKTVRVKRQRAVLDSFSAHELARGVINRFVRHDIGVVVRHGNGLRIEIERPWTKRAHHKVIALESLMYRWREVKSSHPWLEVFDVDRPGIVVAIPPDHVKRMMIENGLGDRIALFDEQPKLALCIVAEERLRPANIALAIGADLGQLTVLIPVALGSANVARALE